LEPVCCSMSSSNCCFLEFVLKIRDITLPTKVHLVKALVFPVVMCGWGPLGQEDPLEKEKGNGNPLQGTCLENPMGRGAWPTIVHGVAKSQTHWSDLSCRYGCESDHKQGWMPKKNNVFELWCWRRFLSPLASKESKLVNPKGNQPWYSLEKPVLKLKLQ